MKDIAEDMFQISLLHEYQTVNEFSKHCLQIQSLHRTRIVDTGMSDLKSLIRTIVREKLQKILSEIQYDNDETESPNYIASLCLGQIMEVIASLSVSRRRNNTLSG
ncbi:hypothetical protein CDAR_464731 [Caerostris darwini]|uniref:Uncharacterized protein n=1 Tax=Caerostris darwini TaxID=1538125 RepID=A0AAV4RCV1_9ARAC|nr:hypothetical protein CDAR_464731 [Caerostris darwini]